MFFCYFSNKAICFGYISTKKYTATPYIKNVDVISKKLLFSFFKKKCQFQICPDATKMIIGDEFVT